MAMQQIVAPGLVDMMTADLGGPRTSAKLERLVGAVERDGLADLMLGLRDLSRNVGRPH